MKSFRNPQYLERYEDVIFDLEQPLVTADPANNAAQVRAPNLKVLLRSKFNVKFVTKTLSFQLIRSGCTCFGHNNNNNNNI